MIGDKKVLAITLARGGSKRVPRKNIIDINGKPLLQYTTDQVKKSRYIDKYIVSTEDIEIQKVCQRLNVEYLNRPKHLAEDTSTSIDAIKHVIDNFPGYDIIVEIMCTNPLKIVEDIDSCIEKIINDNSDCVVSVVRVWDGHPSRLKYIENNRLKDFYPEPPESRRQDLTPTAYIRNGSIYVFTKESFIKNGFFHHGRESDLKIVPYVMPKERTINIDETEDLMMAKILLKNIYGDYTIMF